MHTEYNYTKGVKAFFISISFGFAALSCGISYHTFQSGTMPGIKQYLMAGIAVASILVALRVMLEMLMCRVAVSDKTISRKGAFATTEYDFGEIEGYRPYKDGILLIPKEKGRKTLQISTYYNDHIELHSRIRNRLPNLDKRRAVNEHKDILADPEFGVNSDERRQRLGYARKAAKYANWVGMICSVWFALFKEPYELAGLVCMLLPLSGFLILYRFKGLVRLYVADITSYPSVYGIILFPAYALLIRSIIDYEFEANGAFWMYLGVYSTLAGIAAFVVLRRSKELEGGIKDTGSAALYLLTLVPAYCLGSLIFVNCSFDYAPADEYRTVIVDKYKGRDRARLTYFRLKPWKGQEGIRKIQVPKALYTKLSVGDSISVYENKGLLNIPWHFVDE